VDGTVVQKKLSGAMSDCPATLAAPRRVIGLGKGEHPREQMLASPIKYRQAQARCETCAPIKDRHIPVLIKNKRPRI
jgi:hypothetical protein